jgi:aminoglycoside phosphotransferase (APT) family kinase protein
MRPLRGATPTSGKRIRYRMRSGPAGRFSEEGVADAQGLVPSKSLTDEFDRMSQAIGSDGDVAAVRKLWDEAVSAPEWQGPPTWCHGDRSSMPTPPQTTQ